MDDGWLAERFEAERTRSEAAADRLLGSASEADDAVQEAWPRLGRANTSAVEHLRGWLTTVVARTEPDPVSRNACASLSFVALPTLCLTDRP